MKSFKNAKRKPKGKSFTTVQQKIKNRETNARYKDKTYLAARQKALSEQVKCSECGTIYNVQTHHSTGDYQNHSDLVCMCVSCHAKHHARERMKDNTWIGAETRGA